jgi:hypothetical protein
MDLYNELERKREGIQELGVRGENFLLLCVFGLRQGLLRSGYLHHRAALGPSTGAKAGDTVLDVHEVDPYLNGTNSHDDGSLSKSAPLPQPRLGVRSAQPD